MFAFMYETKCSELQKLVHFWRLVVQSAIYKLTSLYYDCNQHTTCLFNAHEVFFDNKFTSWVNIAVSVQHLSTRTNNNSSVLLYCLCGSISKGHNQLLSSVFHIYTVFVFVFAFTLHLYWSIVGVCFVLTWMTECQMYFFQQM